MNIISSDHEISIYIHFIRTRIQLPPLAPVNPVIEIKLFLTANNYLISARKLDLEGIYFLFLADQIFVCQLGLSPGSNLSKSRVDAFACFSAMDVGEGESCIYVFVVKC